MTTDATTGGGRRPPVMSRRGQRAGDDRLEQGARALATWRAASPRPQWQTRLPKDGRKIGVVVHHVATMYPLEMQLAQGLAAGQPITGVTWDVVHAMNAEHAAGQRRHHQGRGPGPAREEQRRRGRGDPRPQRRAARSRGHDLALRRRAAHLPVHARGPRGAAQLSPPGPHPGGAEGVAGDHAPARRPIMTNVMTCESAATRVAPPPPSVKTRQQAMWASGDFAVIGTTLQIVGELLNEAADVCAGERVLDVAAGNGNATLAAARRFATVTSTDYVPGAARAWPDPRRGRTPRRRRSRSPTPRRCRTAPPASTWCSRPSA